MWKATSKTGTTIKYSFIRFVMTFGRSDLGELTLRLFDERFM